jgi:23S rRNA pseudouridine955/2504/2580 synthase
LKRIKVLFENDECIVLDKPAGLAVQGGEGVSTSLDLILRNPDGRFDPPPRLASADRPGKDGRPFEDGRPSQDGRLLLVHRLDKDTSGALLVAKGHDAAAKFAAFFAGGGKGAVQKRYLAVCAGRPAPESGVIRMNLDIRGRNKNAETAYTRLGGGAFPDLDLKTPDLKTPEFSVLELELGTGRMHQIRRHLQQIHCPVLGDDKYGDFALNKALQKQGVVKRLLLHARRLVIEDAGVDVSAPLPECFSRWLYPVLLPLSPP